MRLAEKLRKAEEMSHQPGNIETRNSRINQDALPFTRKRKRGPRAQQPPKRVRLAEKLRKAEEMSHQPGNVELRNTRINQELDDTRKMIEDLRARS